MSMEELWPHIINGIFFYIAYKLGQMSVRIQMKVGRESSQIQRDLEKVRLTGQRPTITVEEINGIYYAYDGNDFLGQGTSPDELGKTIADRFPNKYHLAKVTIKA